MFHRPKLPFALDGLEPYISANTVDAHYNHHHKQYVDNLNQFLKGTILEGQNLREVIRLSERLKDDRETFERIWQNACQHFMHSLYWSVLGPSGDRPTGFDNAFDEFRRTAIEKFGDGWVYMLRGGTVGELNDTGIPPVDTVLVIDVWEHAYYLDYKWEREKYVDAFLNVISWDRFNQNTQTTSE